MVMPPYWLTSKGVDEITTEEYDPICGEFMQALLEEEELDRKRTEHAETHVLPPLRYHEYILGIG